jgi:hypothetical protein
MCRRSAGSLQGHVRPNSNLDVVSDVTGVNVCIFGVFELQPGRAAPKSALQGPSGTFVWWFLPSWCRVEFFHLQHFWCMATRIFMNKLFLSCWLGMRGQTGGGEASTFKFLVFCSYVKVKQNVEWVLLHVYFCDYTWWYSGLVAQSVQRLTTVWTIRDRIPVGTRFSASPDRSCGPPSLLYSGYWVFPGGKVRPARATDNSPLLVPRSWKSRVIRLPTLWATPGL